MNAALAPMRERRREVMARPERVREILIEGSREGARRRAGDDGTGP